jgi:hypothetical protein
MRVAILAAIIAGTINIRSGIRGPHYRTVCRSYSDGVFSFIECADGIYIVIGFGGERRFFRVPNACFPHYPRQPQPPVYK